MTEEDTELRDLVSATLDNCGILGKIKAQLRANVYIALEQGGENIKKKSPLVNNKLVEFLATTNGRLVASLVREFLVFFDLDFTLAVFDPETNIGNDFKYRGREKLVEALGLTELTDIRCPLLSEIMRLSKVSILKSETPTPTNDDDMDDEDGTDVQSSLVEDVVSEKSNRSVSSVSDRSSGSRTLTTDNKKANNSNKSAGGGGNGGAMDRNSDNGGGATKGTTSGATLDPKQKSIFSPKDKDASPFPSLASLGDLPPLGGGGHNVLGDLPPLSGLARPPGSNLSSSLAPLKKVPSVVQKQDSEDSNLSNVSSGKRDLPQFGFDKDHVISESSDSFNINKQKQPGGGDAASGGDKKEDVEEDPSVEEDIEEELDSFLNSSVSAADDFTKDEAVPNSDVSLKADYLESL